MTKIGQYLCLVLLLLCSPLSTGAELTPEQVKTAYVYNFLKYVQWPDENQRRTLKVLYVGDNDKLLSVLKSLEQQKVRSLALSVSAGNSDSAITGADVLVVDKSRESRLGDINALILNRPILVIADNAREKQLFGFNFVNRSGGKIGFEINRYNMVYNKLTVSKDIVILGGTELDVASMVKDMESTLQANREQYARLQSQVTEKQRQLDAQQQKQKQQQAKITELDNTLAQQQTAQEALKSQQQALEQKMADTQASFSRQQAELDAKQQELKNKTDEITALSASISINEARIREQKSVLAGYETELAMKEKSLASQSETLEAQSTIIQTQKTLLYISIALIISISISVMLIYRGARVKNQLFVQLAHKHTELESANAQIIRTRDQLLKSEKMAALGSLVAGVAHEINTPIGVGVTSSTHMQEQLSRFIKRYKAEEVTEADLDQLLDDLTQSLELLVRNLDRAARLIKSFKQVSIDQSHEEIRTLQMKEYIQEVCDSLQHELKRGGHKVKINAEQQLSYSCEAGAMAQVITNLVMNSLIHGFRHKTDGEIRFDCYTQENRLIIDYRDNGCGIADETVAKVFDPFFTTRRGEGSSGLGMHVSFNIVNQKFGGDLQCLPSDTGAHFRISLPLQSSE
ncbi:DUF4154 domain-containing protein [Shewanella sp. JM162201]|uniref:histidine kinase n=1 Tax=Shewanella jiangmenensis TaxID=2837387 RepID=A0ABS5V3Z4_9GAMM|nr:YfiR/HmsC family protein [Shewanella jiangmenensis]MBT1445176.1 DUF4154 domain-containing protein [Shewanella jiangmenensis]